MNSLNITIELSIEEIKLLEKLTGLPFIQKLWIPYDAKLAMGLHEFFKELIDE